MGGTSQTLTVGDVVAINRRMISAFGGVFFEGDRNLANSGSLEFLLEEVGSSLFGQELHSTSIEQAAVIGWRIIAGHLFHDGNKRTGMEACRLFLDLNGYEMRIDFGVVDIALGIAQGSVSLPEFTQWLQARTVEKP